MRPVNSKSGLATASPASTTKYSCSQPKVAFTFEILIASSLMSVAIIAVLLVIFSSIAILQVEDSSESNIKTAEDALWWTYVTITTVGYGDKYPVTTEGRIIAAILMTAGVGLFGTFTAFVASWFVVGKRITENSDIEEIKE